MIAIKKYLILGASLLALVFCVGAFAQENVRVYVNGIRIAEDVIMSNDRTYMPVRAVTEAMGAQVHWEESSQSVFISFTEDDLIANLVSSVSSSVVAIVGNYNGTDSYSQYNNPTVHGSGVIYKSNGYILTNAHVVEDIKNLTVILNDGTSLPGRVEFSDAQADLAIVKVDKIGLNPIRMADKSAILSGRTVIAIGTPVSLSMRNTVTKGIISGSDVSLNDSYYKLIQTDASINPGNSGGPLLNVNGELLGINSSKYNGTGIDNMAFAVPVDTVQYVINQFEQHGKILRPELDITLEQSWEAKIGLPTSKGITVKTSQNQVLKSGDVIQAVNDIQVHSITDWNEAIKATYDGNSLTVQVLRDGVVVEEKV